MRLHYHHQQWLRDSRARRWQRFHLFWPRGRAWRGIGVTVWCHEFSTSFGSDA